MTTTQGNEHRNSSAQEADGKEQTAGAVTSASAADVRPLPGSYAGRPTGMENYIVALKEAEPQSDAAPMGRRELYEMGVANTATFRHKLEKWLESEALSSQVANIGEPTAFSLISLTSTPEAAERIEQLPEVEYVLRDSEDTMGIVR